MDQNINQTEQISTEQQARRRLLKMGMYVPPAILGVMTIRPEAAEAATITCGGVVYTVSACGVSCCPCATSFNSNSCKESNCDAGCCARCPKTYNSTVFATLAECEAAVAFNTCGCTCKKAGKNYQFTCP